MSLSSLELTKLKLLTLSKQRLMYAEQKDWDALKRIENQWQALLDQSFQAFSSDLSSVSEQLSADNNQVIELIAKAQSVLVDQRKSSNKKLNQVKKYLKY